jgi:hypothetical protein
MKYLSPRGYRGDNFSMTGESIDSSDNSKLTHGSLRKEHGFKKKQTLLGKKRAQK